MAKFPIIGSPKGSLVKLEDALKDSENKNYFVSLATCSDCGNIIRNQENVKYEFIDSKIKILEAAANFFPQHGDHAVGVVCGDCAAKEECSCFQVLNVSINDEGKIDNVILLPSNSLGSNAVIPKELSDLIPSSTIGGPTAAEHIVHGKAEEEESNKPQKPGPVKVGTKKEG